MDVRRIGIITNSATSQGGVNDDHAADLAGAVTALGYQATTYDLAQGHDLDKLVADYRQGRLDLVFNNAAGRHGGDGTVEGFFDVHKIPYVGSDALATAVAFDKRTTKAVVAAHGVPIIRGLDFSREQFDTRRNQTLDEIEYGLKFPVVVKASEGSDSIGVSLVKTRKALTPALKIAFHEDDHVVVEDFVKRWAEITCLVLGNGKQAYALTPVERVFRGDILYPRGVTKRSYRVPTHVGRDILQTIQRYSVIAHNALGCSDYSRSDFLVIRRGLIYFLELNAHAGLGTVGPTVYAAKATHKWSHAELIGELIKIATKRSEHATARARH